MKKGLSLKGIGTVAVIALGAVMLSRKIKFLSDIVWGASKA